MYMPQKINVFLYIYFKEETNFTLKKVEIIVFDEADMLFEMGFLE